MNRSHKKERTYECKYCYIEYYKVSGFKRHLKKRHDEVLPTCDVCNKEFLDKDKLKRHKRCHQKDPTQQKRKPRIPKLKVPKVYITDGDKTYAPLSPGSQPLPQDQQAPIVQWEAAVGSEVSQAAVLDPFIPDCHPLAPTGTATPAANYYSGDSYRDSINWVGKGTYQSIVNDNSRGVYRNEYSDDSDQDLSSDEPGSKNPLHEACKSRRQKDVVSLLNERTADLNLRSKGWKTPLHYCCASEQKPDLKAGQNSGSGSQDEAAAIASLLLENGADIEAKDVNDATPLHMAVLAGNVKVTELLINKGANLKQRANYSWDLLSSRMSKGNVRKVEEWRHDGPVSLSVVEVSCILGYDPILALLMKTGLRVERISGIKEDLQIVNGGTGIVDSELNDWLHNTDTSQEECNEDNWLEAYPNNALQYACFMGHEKIVQLLLGEDVNTESKNRYNISPVHFACRAGDNRIVNMLTEHMKDFSVKDGIGRTCLHHAAAFGKTGVSKSMLRLDLSPNIRDFKDNTPLMLACSKGHVDTAEMLIEERADINAVNKMGRSALANAVIKCHTKVAKILIKHGGDVNIKLPHGTTILHYAVKFDKTAEIIQLLIESMADINVTNDNKRTPLHEAVYYRNEAAAILLLDKVGDIETADCKGESVLTTACKKKMNGLVKRLLEMRRTAPCIDDDEVRDDDISSIDQSGETLLHNACRNGNWKVASQLIENGADTNSKDIAGRTPLFVACLNFKRCSETIELLLKEKADVNIPDNEADTPLHIVVDMGHKPLVKALLRSANTSLTVNVEQVNKNGQTPLLIACGKGYTAIARILIEKGADIKRTDMHRQTALHLACKHGHADVVELLLEKHADENAGDKNGNTPLHIATLNNQLSAIIALLSKHDTSSKPVKNCKGQIPLHIACLIGHTKVAQLLIKRVGHINITDKYGCTSLYLACENGFVTIAEMLLSSGADAVAPNRNGNTPLHASVINEELILVQRLLKNLSIDDANKPNKDNKSAIDLAYSEKLLPIIEVFRKEGKICEYDPKKPGIVSTT